MFKKVTIIALIFLISFSSIVFAQEWDTFSEKDDMSGVMIWYAGSPKTTSNNPMSTPYYNGTKASLHVGTDGFSEWCYISFNKEPIIKNTEIKDCYNAFTTRLEWDDDICHMDFTKEWGTSFIHFVEDKKAINKIMENNKVLLELDWYGEGKVYFEFTLNSSADAIKKIREKTN